MKGVFSFNVKVRKRLTSEYVKPIILVCQHTNSLMDSRKLLLCLQSVLDSRF